MPASRCVIVNPWHWLDEDGSIPDGPPSLRAQALRVAQSIEYGGPLPQRHGRATMIACRRRPAGAACRGLLHVAKQPDNAIYVYCPVCGSDEYVIHSWEDTLWAKGPMEPMPFEGGQEDEAEILAQLSMAPSSAPHDALSAALSDLGSRLSGTQLRAMIGTTESPSWVLSAVLKDLPTPPTKRALEHFAAVLIEAWNSTPRDELNGVSPATAHARSAVPPTAKAGRNQPCPCGSGRKYKRCCMDRDVLH